MGVPGLFRLIVNQYQESFHSYLLFEENIDNFFIDFNAMVYEAYYLLVDKYETQTKTNLSVKQIENKIIEEVIQYVDYLINTIVKPKNLVYIAMDGPVPMAKVIQQRYRRFKTPIEEYYVKQIKDKYEIKETKKLIFDKTNISPGTDFMSRLSKKMIDAIKKDKIKNGQLREIIVSDTNIPGEGEHKFMDILKSKKTEKNAIYSPDADIIVLSLISDIENIYILKSFNSIKQIIKLEENEKNSFIYLDIDFCKKKFIELLTQQYLEIVNQELVNTELNQFILKDWSFLSILSGNDFVIPLPFLKINKNNNEIMPILTKNYQEIFNILQQPLITDKNEINLEFFKKLVKSISEIELQQYRKQLKHIHACGKKDKKKEHYQDEKLKDLTPYEKELNYFYHIPFYDIRHPLFKEYQQEFRKINYFNDDWKKKYYQYYFNHHEDGFINKVCKEYMKILSWNLQYYFNNIPPSWDYYYPYKMPPLFIDLYQYLETLNFNEYLFHFHKDTPIKPLPQLMLILPESSAKTMLPTVLYHALKIENYYLEDETKIPLEAMIGHKFIYTEPCLELPNKELVETIFNQHKDKLSKTELSRNKKSKLYIKQNNSL